MTLPGRVFLDTNVFIVGAVDPKSPEGQILRWLGFEMDAPQAETVVSEELFVQIRRVSRRLYDKDWGAELLYRIWRGLNLHYVLLDEAEYAAVEARHVIPREDISVYLTARAGAAQSFISSNHSLVKALVEQQGEFECLTPDEFVEHYLRE